MLDYFARLQLDESVREIVSPAAKGLIRLTLFCRPLHGVPINAAANPTVSSGYDIFWRRTDQISRRPFEVPAKLREAIQSPGKRWIASVASLLAMTMERAWTPSLLPILLHFRAQTVPQIDARHAVA